MICALVLDAGTADPAGALAAIARACSPRVELHGGRAVLFDASGLSRVLGPPPVIARQVGKLAADWAIPVRLAIAGTKTAAWLLAHAQAGPTIVRPGREAESLAPLSLGWLASLPEDGGEADARSAGHGTEPPKVGGRARHYRLAPGPGRRRARRRAAAGPRDEALATFARWGVQTLGALAALPRADLHARLGAEGVRLHQAACGEDWSPFVPEVEPRGFVERLVLDWPIEGLEPLAFVLARMCESLSRALVLADRGAVAVTTRLRLVTREDYTRTLELPSPMHEARVLRTLLMLDFESHPPPAAIDEIEVTLDVAPGAILQGGLFARTLPSPEELATLTARLGALLGAAQVGAPALVDTHDARDSTMKAFRAGPAPDAGSRPAPLEGPQPLVRRFRPPVPARVTVEAGGPVRIVPEVRDLAGGRVAARAGPWRTSGRWWRLDGTGWDRDEWDVELADRTIYRIARDRASGRWEIDGIVD